MLLHYLAKNDLSAG